MAKKPTIFVGSSLKGLTIAQAIQAELSYEANVTLWNQNVFRTINVPLENLTRALNEFDFAIFIFLPEDPLTIKDSQVMSVRDNVLFELGLFIGKLGRERVFFVAPSKIPSQNLHLPSDLTGIDPARFDLPQPEGSREGLRSAVGPALFDFREMLQRFEPNYLYDGKKHFNERHYIHRNSFIYEKRERISPASDGNMQFMDDGVLKLERNNFEGRYEIELRPNGQKSPTFQKSISRFLRVRCEAKIEGGNHTLRFVMKDIEADEWTDQRTVTIGNTDWKSIEVELNSPPCVDLLFRIDDLNPAKVPSSVFLRNIIVAEE